MHSWLYSTKCHRLSFWSSQLTLSIAIVLVMLRVVMLHVIMPKVVAPNLEPTQVKSLNTESWMIFWQFRTVVTSCSVNFKQKIKDGRPKFYFVLKHKFDWVSCWSISMFFFSFASLHFYVMVLKEIRIYHDFLYTYLKLQLFTKQTKDIKNDNLKVCLAF
jgi:hypothetical protein